MGRLHVIGRGIEDHGTIQLDGRQPPAEAGVLGLLDQQGFDPRRRDLLYATQEFFNRAELGDQLHCRLLTDALHAGNIVRRIAHEPHDLHDARRLHAETFAAFRFAEPLVFHRIVDAHVGRQELEHVLIASNDDDVEAGLFRLVGERADQIVRLVAGLPDGGNVEGLHHAMDVRNLSAHAFRHRRPLCFVCLELRMAQCRTLFVKRHHETIRLPLTKNLQQRRRKTEDGVGLEAFGIIQSRQGEERTIDIGAPVDQVERLAAGLGGRHGARDRGPMSAAVYHICGAWH